MASPDLLIYLVEDDADDRFVMQQAFAEAGHGGSLRVFSSSESFLRTLIQPGTPRPSLIVLDFNMPIINGGELLLRLKLIEEIRDIPVVVYSTGMRALLKETLLAYGAAACFEKGMAYSDFLKFATALVGLAGNASVAAG